MKRAVPRNIGSIRWLSCGQGGTIMAYQPTDPFRAPMSEEEIRRQSRLNSLGNEYQPDPELEEGPASGPKVAMFAIAIAVVMGALFSGLNNTTVQQAGTE